MKMNSAPAPKYSRPVWPREGADHPTARAQKWCRLLPVFLAGLLLSSCGQPSTPEPPATAGAPATNTTAPPEAKPAFARLKGKWQRPDGGYVLEIESVAADGKVGAGYYNPDPIRVSRARVFEKEGSTRLFVELNDTGYPGCTYTLTYDAQHDQLFGDYFQAAMQQTFDVTFARLKEGPP